MAAVSAGSGSGSGSSNGAEAEEETEAYDAGQAAGGAGAHHEHAVQSKPSEDSEFDSSEAPGSDTLSAGAEMEILKVPIVVRDLSWSQPSLRPFPWKWQMRKRNCFTSDSYY